jgi:hypothetical protein
MENDLNELVHLVVDKVVQARVDGALGLRGSILVGKLVDRAVDALLERVAGAAVVVAAAVVAAVVVIVAAVARSRLVEEAFGDSH